MPPYLDFQLLGRVGDAALPADFLGQAIALDLL